METTDLPEPPVRGGTIVEVKCSIPYALRNEGAAAMGETKLRRLAADRIEELERALLAAEAALESIAGSMIVATAQAKQVALATYRVLDPKLGTGLNVPQESGSKSPAR